MKNSSAFEQTRSCCHAFVQQSPGPPAFPHSRIPAALSPGLSPWTGAASLIALVPQLSPYWAEQLGDVLVLRPQMATGDSPSSDPVNLPNKLVSPDTPHQCTREKRPQDESLITQGISGLVWGRGHASGQTGHPPHQHVKDRADCQGVPPPLLKVSQLFILAFFLTALTLYLVSFPYDKMPDLQWKKNTDMAGTFILLR